MLINPLRCILRDRWIQCKRKMKRLKHIIIFLFISFNSIDAQKYQLIDARHFSDNSKDCRKIGNCISDKFIKNDTLNLIIYFDNNCRDLNAYKDTFSYYHDTISMNLNDTNKIKYSTFFNNSKNKIDTIIIYPIVGMHQCMGGYDTQRNQYKLLGFKNIPKVVQLNHETLCNCPTRPIKFDIFNNDTINIINSNGRRDGLWITFYESGQIHEKKYFDNGFLKDGKTFDMNGNDLHYYSDFEGGISNIHVDIDTTKNK
jgi:hypothetical protein